MPQTIRLLRSVIGPAILLATCSNVSARTNDPPPAALGAELCRQADVEVQVLGSGGPVAEGSRAGTSYAVWIDGRAQLLIDAGPGSLHPLW